MNIEQRGEIETFSGKHFGFVVDLVELGRMAIRHRPGQFTYLQTTEDITQGYEVSVSLWEPPKLPSICLIKNAPPAPGSGDLRSLEAFLVYSSDGETYLKVDPKKYPIAKQFDRNLWPPEKVVHGRVIPRDENEIVILGYVATLCPTSLSFLNELLQHATSEFRDRYGR